MRAATSMVRRQVTVFGKALTEKSTWENGKKIRNKGMESTMMVIVNFTMREDGNRI